MALPFWLIVVAVSTVLAILAIGSVMLFRSHLRLLDQQTAHAREVEGLTDRLWSMADREARYRSLVEAQGDFIVRLDGGRIVYANAAYAGLFGTDDADLIGSEAQLPQLALRLRAEHDGCTRSFDERLSTHDGERWIAWVETVLPAADGGHLIQRVGRDISARIADEDALVEARGRAEAASEAKSRFLATVSHEFRTPLNGILGMSDLLQDTGLDAEQSTYVQALRTSGEALLALVDDILDFAKVEAGRIELASEPFDMVQLVETVTELMAPRAQAKGIELAAHIAPDVPARLMGDRDRLRQILLNLVGNAVKFTSAGGVGLSLRRAGSAIEIQVADTGPGIPADRLEAIFGEFEQVEHGSTPNSGTGLGLAIVRRLARAMGGEVYAESRFGNGASFRVVLPLPSAGGQDAVTVPQWFGRQVLVASPAPFAAGFLAETIRETGATVSIAGDADAAREIIQRLKPSAVLIDHAFGDAPAKQLAKAVADAGIRDCLILLPPAARRQFGAPQEFGFSGFLIKPVRARSLYERLGQPALRALSARVVSDPERQAKRSRLTILVAEDNEINALLLTRTLERLGATPIWVKDGRAALQRIAAGFAGEATKLDLALLDIRMPGMTGLDCTRAVRALEAQQGRASRLFIAAVTANVSAADRQAALAAGLDDCLAKPLERQALTRLLARFENSEPQPLSA